MNNELLATIRKERGFTQEQMAKSLDYKDKSSYCLIENGKVSITLECTKKIKEILQLTDKEFNLIFFNEKVEETQTIKVS